MSSTRFASIFQVRPSNLEVVAEFFNLRRRLRIPVGDQARDVAFKSARKSRSDGGDGICSLGIAPQARQMDEFHDAVDDSPRMLDSRRENGEDGEILVGSGFHSGR